MPDTMSDLTAPAAKWRPALSATSDMPAFRKEAQQPSDFATAKAPPARSTTKDDTGSSSPAVEEADLDDAMAHETLVSAIGEYATVASSAPKAETTTTQFSKPRPNRDQFEHYDEYDIALTSWAVEKASHEEISKFSRQNAEKQAAEQRSKKLVDAADKIVQSWSAKCAAATKRYPDFAEVTGKDDLHISETMRNIILFRKTGPDIAYALGKNPKEAARIAALPNAEQAVEMGKFEATIKPAQRPRAGAKLASSSKGETMEQYALRRNKEIQEQRAARYGVLRK